MAPPIQPVDLSIPQITLPPCPFPVEDAKGYALIYCRISGTDDPRTASLGTQAYANIERAYRDRYAVRQEDLYFERLTGMNSEEHRPLLNECRERLARHEAHAIVSYDTDRLARSDDLKFIVRHIERKGGKVLFAVYERTPGMIGDLMLDIKAYASSQEYVNIADRTERGRKDIRSFGKMVGPGPNRYGYLFNKEKRCREIDPETAPVVRLIFDLVANKGFSTIDVMRHLTAAGIKPPYMTRKNRTNKYRVSGWSATRVGYIIREESYLGFTFEGRTRVVRDAEGQLVKKLTGGRLRTVREPVPREDWTLVKNSDTPALVDRDTWERANAQLDGNMKNTRDEKRNAARFFLLRGILFCDHCTMRMTPAVLQERPTVRPRSVYQCSTRRTKWRHGRDCDSPQTRAEPLEAAVWELVKKYVMTPGLIDREFDRAKRESASDMTLDELKEVERDQKAAKRKLDQYVEAFAEADTKMLRDAVKAKIEEQRKEVVRFEARVGTLTARLRPYQRIDETKAETLAVVERFKAGIDDLDDEGKRKLMDGLGMTVYAYKGKFRIRMAPPVSLPPVSGASKGVAASTTCRRDSNSNATPVVLNLGPSRVSFRINKAGSPVEV